MNRLEAVRQTRDAIVTTGGAFITSSHTGKQEALLGLPERSLYFRGRSAVLGDPPPSVVANVFGLFPDWLVTLMLEHSAPVLPAPEAIRGYRQACADWGSEEFAESDAVGEAAELLLRIVDGADLAALPLAAGWRDQERPANPPERLAYALMLAREVRGGLHFAALKVVGLSIADATIANPTFGRSRLRRTGWRPEDVDDLVKKAESHTDLHNRWLRAEELTDEMFAETMKVLDQAEIERLTDILTHLPTAQKV